VGEPEAEEHDVVATIRPPLEQVGPDEADPLVAHAGGGEREHLRRCIHGRDPGGVAEQLLGPSARAAGELEHVARRPEGLERRLELGSSGRREGVVAVLGGDGSVVGDLLGQQPLEPVVVVDRSHGVRGRRVHRRQGPDARARALGAEGGPGDREPSRPSAA
jgi:hypothetical protein